MTYINLKSKKILPNLENLPFTEYYESLPRPGGREGKSIERNLLLSKVSKATGKSVYTVRKWAKGLTTPAPLEKIAIAKILKCTDTCLFPKKQ